MKTHGRGQKFFLNLTINLGLVIGYCYGFKALEPLIGNAFGVLSFIPVGISGWLLGILYSITMAVLMTVINIVLYSHQMSFTSPMFLEALIPAAAGLLLGIILRWHNRTTAKIEMFSEQYSSDQKKLNDEIYQKEIVEKALHEAERQYRQLVETTSDIIASIDLQGNFVFVNPAGLKMVGYDQETMRHLKFSDVVLHEYADRIKRVHLRQYLSGIRNVYNELPLVTSRQEVRWLGYTSTLMHEGGKAIGFHTVARDITSRIATAQHQAKEQEELDRKIHERTAELTKANQALQIEISERSWIEEALRDSEEKYRTLVEDICDVVFQTDAEFRLTFVNTAWFATTGYTQQECKGKPLLSYIGPQYRDEIKSILEKVKLQHSNYQRCEFSIVTKEGTIRWIDASLHAKIGDDDVFSGADGILRDVTDIKVAEAALRESREFLDKIVNSIIDPVFVKNQQHQWVLVNEAFCEFIGHAKQELLGKSDYDYFPREQADVFWKYDDHVLQTGEDNVNEEYFTNGGNEIRTISTKKACYVDENGNKFIVGIIRDITVQKETENKINKLNTELDLHIRERTKQLETTNQELRKLSRAVEQSPVSTLITDLAGNIEYVNEKFCQVTGYTKEEVLGKNPRILKSGETRGEDYDSLWKTISNGGEWSGVFHNRRKSGEMYWDSTLIFAIKNRESVVTHYIALKEDITEKYKLEAQVRRSQRLEVIGTLAGGIAHDLNNVLSPILMAIQLLRMKISDAKGLNLLTTLETTVNRGADIVKQVLSFARGAEGERILLQPKHLLREIQEIIHETFPRLVNIEADIPKDLWPVLGDATQLHQVFMNLCVNARDAMPHGGTLTVKAENIEFDEKQASLHLDAKKGPYVLVSISDSGTGIPQNLLDKIFDPFFTTKEVGKGTGLGLSTVLTIVKSHHGFISVYSELNRGSQFKVYIPASLNRSAVKAEMKPSEPPRGRGEHILLIDDEVSIREITRELLEQAHYEVFEASNGVEALEIFKQQGDLVDVVITDMMMPKMDGSTVIRELQKINPEIKIIAASGLLNNENMPGVHSPNVHAFLPKPYKPEKLFWVLDALLH